MSELLMKDSQNYIFEKELLPNFPKNILIELTNACNHKCVFCANRKMTRKVGFIDKEFLINILKQANSLGAKEVGYYATGEPFMCKDLSEYVKKAKDIGYEYIYITTNGELATEDRIKGVVDAGVDSIKFSINAGTRETYKIIHGKDVFDKVIENLKSLNCYRQQSNKQFKIFVSFIKTKVNENEFEILRNILKDYADDIVSLDVYNQGGNMYEINDILTLNENYKPIKAPCHMLFNRINITYEGYLNICCVDFQNYLAIEDLNTTSLKNAWHGDKFVKMRRRHLDNKLKGTCCYNCINNCNEKVVPLVEKLATQYERGYSKDLENLKFRIRNV